MNDTAQDSDFASDGRCAPAESVVMKDAGVVLSAGMGHDNA